MPVGTMSDIEAAVYSRLTSDNDVGGVNILTGGTMTTPGRIYPIEGRFDDKMPIVVFDLVTDTIDATFAVDHADNELQIDVFGHKKDGALAARTLADRVIEQLHRTAIPIVGFSSCRLQAFGRGLLTIEDDVFRVMLRFRVMATGS